MASQLRSYQLQIIERTRALMQAGKRSVVIQAPTGSGKTLLTAHMLGNAAAKSIPSFFVVHRRELVKQSSRAFSDQDIRHGICAAGFPHEPDALVQVCSVQTLANRHPKLREPRLIVWDEAHHVAAASWSKLFQAYPRAYHIGLTATPMRLDGRGLGKWFSEMVHGPSVEWLIENKYLSPYRIFAPPSISTDHVHSRYGDFVRSELTEIADKPKITGDVIAHYKRLSAGKRGIVNCVSIPHSQRVAQQFREAGFRAEHVDGDTPHEERDGAVRAFVDGKLDLLCNVDLFGEGFDVPAIEVCILLRPTQSLGLYLQQVGRALRPSPGKEEALILDHAGNCERHGFPDDDREWSLGDAVKNKRDKESMPAVKICPVCFAAQSPGSDQCKFCGTPFILKPRTVQEVEGELKEIDKSQIQRQRRKEQGSAQTMEDLIALGRARGYKSPEGWAKHLFFSRRRKSGGT